MRRQLNTLFDLLLLWPVAVSARRFVLRNIVFVPTTSFASPSPTSTTLDTSPSQTQTQTSGDSDSSYTPTTLATSTASQNATIYRLDIPDNSGSNNLKYLYLFFLLIGLVIIAITVRVMIVKRRRKREQEKRALNRNEALRLDLENRVSDEEPNESRTGYTFPLFSMNLFRNPPRTTVNESTQEENHPPPPYPTHIKTSEPARNLRLPVYQEVSEEEEEDDDSDEQQSNISQRHLRINDDVESIPTSPDSNPHSIRVDTSSSHTPQTSSHVQSTISDPSDLGTDFILRK